MVKTNHLVDKQADRSDVKSLLENIENMYLSCMNVLNTYTQTTLMLAITVEAKMLQMKLSVMKERWMKHLPFKEASSVDFYDWSKKIGSMGRSLAGPEESSEADGGVITEYCPSKHFMLDLYSLLPENVDTSDSPAYYSELDIPRFISSQEKIRKLITKKWPEYKYKFSDMVAKEVNHRIVDVLQPLADRSINIRMACCEELQHLSVTLYELYDMPKGVIQRDQFARLAERVVNEDDYGGRKAQQSARRDVDNLKNTTPEDEWERRRETEIEATIEFINELKYGRQVFTFLGHSHDINGRYAGLGKFFNSIRRDISVEELSLLIEYLYRIHFLLEDKYQSAPADTASPSAVNTPQQSGETVQESTLPMFFTHAMRTNTQAADMLLGLLRKAGPYMACNLTKQQREQPEAKPYADWKWNHLMQVFIDHGIINEKTRQTDFAEFLVHLLPGRKSGNILQSMYRNSGNRNSDILADVKSFFRPVKRFIASSQEKETE